MTKESKTVCFFNFFSRLKNEHQQPQLYNTSNALIKSMKNIQIIQDSAVYNFIDPSYPDTTTNDFSNILTNKSFLQNMDTNKSNKIKRTRSASKVFVICFYFLFFFIFYDIL